MKLDGGGRKVAYPNLDAELAEWIRLKRENKQPVSRRTIKNEAVHVFLGTELKVFLRQLFLHQFCISNVILNQVGPLA